MVQLGGLMSEIWPFVFIKIDKKTVLTALQRDQLKLVGRIGKTGVFTQLGRAEH